MHTFTYKQKYISDFSNTYENFLIIQQSFTIHSNFCTCMSLEYVCMHELQAHIHVNYVCSMKSEEINCTKLISHIFLILTKSQCLNIINCEVNFHASTVLINSTQVFILFQGKMKIRKKKEKKKNPQIFHLYWFTSQGPNKCSVHCIHGNLDLTHK